MKKIIIYGLFIISSLSASDKLFGKPVEANLLDYCNFNVLTCANHSKYHTGLDYSKYGSNKIVATNDGIVVRLEKMNSHDHGMGTNVIIEHTLTDNSKIYSTYSHLASYKSTLYKGYKINKGEEIGVKGGSGYGNPNYWGKHLHFEMKTKAVTGSPYGGTYYGYTPTNPINYGYLNPNDYIGKVKAKSNDSPNDNLNNQKVSGIFDGAGSLVSPNENCWGCNKDEAKMHPHSGTGSTIAFQWLYDSETCSQIDLFADRSIEVAIKAKAWNEHLTKKAFKVTLGANPVTLTKPSNNSWTTFAITSIEPINYTIPIYAYCKTPSDTYHKGNSKSIDKGLVDVTYDYFWTGTGSLITQATQRGSNEYGIDKDIAVTFSTKKSLTSFQWLTSSSCNKLKISEENNQNININEVKIKGWSAKDWSSNKCTSLPCILDAPSIDSYYVIKVKSNPNAIPSGKIVATCTNDEPTTVDILPIFYGAIAYDNYYGAFGYSYRYLNQSDAESGALSKCIEANGADCKIVRSAGNTCMALAKNTYNSAGFSYSQSLNQAKELALEACYNVDNLTCNIGIAFCTDGEGL